MGDPVIRTPAGGVRLFSDLEALSRAAAEEVVAAARAAVAERGRFAIALAGGRTPKELYRLLAGPYREQMPWAQTWVFWGDERYVPHDHPHSNCRMAREAMLDHVPVPPEQLFPMPTADAAPSEAARAYEAVLRQLWARWGQPVREGADPFPALFDLVLLGMGADGHTASLFPGTSAVSERERWAMAVEAPAEPPQRLTLTLPLLAGARRLLFLVGGADKREKLSAVLRDPAGSGYPAGMVAAAGHADWYVDEAAYGDSC
jgi:6-phosphogluconolactonase